MEDVDWDFWGFYFFIWRHSEIFLTILSLYLATHFFLSEIWVRLSMFCLPAFFVFWSYISQFNVFFLKLWVCVAIINVFSEFWVYILNFSPLPWKLHFFSTSIRNRSQNCEIQLRIVRKKSWFVRWKVKLPNIFWILWWVEATILWCYFAWVGIPSVMQAACHNTLLHEC